jgi:uncharacterized protein YecE (DUF72 family)
MVVCLADRNSLGSALSEESGREVMDAKFMAEKPDEIVFTMKLTMTVKHWGELRDQLQIAYPSWELSNKIDSLLTQARKVFYPPLPSE